MLGHQENDPLVADALGLAKPRKGDFISARVVLAGPEFRGDVAEINGSFWRLAEDQDPITAAPVLPRGAEAES